MLLAVALRLQVGDAWRMLSVRFAPLLIYYRRPFFFSDDWDGLSPRLRCLLHSPFNQLADTRHAFR